MLSNIFFATLHHNAFKKALNIYFCQMQRCCPTFLNAEDYQNNKPGFLVNTFLPLNKENLYYPYNAYICQNYFNMQTLKVLKA